MNGSKHFTNLICSQYNFHLLLSFPTFEPFHIYIEFIRYVYIIFLSNHSGDKILIYILYNMNEIRK
jgi:hypothetical protein